MAKPCVVYLRVSDRHQVQGASLTDQEAACRAFAGREGFRVVEVYRDDGISAWKDDIRHRPAFERLLVAAKAGRFKAVLVYKLDRFARRARIYHEARYQLEQAGVRLLSSSEPNDTSAAGLLSSGMLAQFAEFYSAQLSERITAAKHGQVGRGMWVGPPPFGYVLCDRKLAPSPLALWVALIFEGYRLVPNTVEIAAALNAARVPLRSGKPWTKDSVLMVLHNRAYLGFVGGRATAYTLGQHKPLITQAAWDAAHAQLAARRRSPAGRTMARASELPYEPHCGLCGGSMQRVSSGDRVYLRCRGSLNKTCKAPGVRFDLVQAQLAELRQGGTVVARVWLTRQGVQRFE